MLEPGALTPAVLKLAESAPPRSAPAATTSAPLAAIPGRTNLHLRMIETRPQKTQERALLIGLEKDGVSKWDLRDSLEELRELASSAGAKVVDTVTQKLPRPTAPYYIGRGKAESIKDSCQNQHGDARLI